MAGVTISFADGSGLALDCTLAQGHDRQAEITEHPVEEGADIADHVRPKPVDLAITAIQSVAPLQIVGLGILGALAPAALLGAIAAPNRHHAAFERLETAWSKGELVTVNTGLAVYESMAIASLKVDKTTSTFDLPLAIGFRQVIRVSAQTVQVPKNALGLPSPTATAKPVQRAQVNKTVAQATPKAARGPVAKAPATAPQSTKSQSVLFKVLGGKIF